MIVNVRRQEGICLFYLEENEEENKFMPNRYLMPEGNDLNGKDIWFAVCCAGGFMRALGRPVRKGEELKIRLKIEEVE